MISLDKLKSVRHVISHANCPDGISAALILKDALPDVRVSFMAYGTQEHMSLVPEPGMLFCDFTPYIPVDPRTEQRDEVLIRLWRASGAIVLDHHPTARDIVEAFGENGIFGLNDKNECGAWLAYEHVWEQVVPEKVWGEDNKFSFKWELRDRVREFARLAAIRDTWKSGDLDFEEASRQASMLTFLPQRLRSEMPLSEALAFCKDEKLAAIIRERQLDSAHSGLREGASFTTSKGTRGIMFQGVAATSDAAELAEKSGISSSLTLTHPDGSVEHGTAWESTPDLIVGFHYRADAGKLQLQFSMRSHTGYDVSAFAKHHGGGGHKAAAGFTVDVRSRAQRESVRRISPTARGVGGGEVTLFKYWCSNCGHDCANNSRVRQVCTRCGKRMKARGREDKRLGLPHPVQPIEDDGNDVIRFKGNAIVRYLLDHGGIDLNQLARLSFTREDHVQFAQLIGYSVSGFSELSYVSDEDYNRIADAAEVVEKRMAVEQGEK